MNNLKFKFDFIINSNVKNNIDENNKIYENPPNPNIIMNNRIDNVNNKIPNYEFSLGNKNHSEKNFNLNNDLNINNININNSEDYSLIKPKEESQQKFYYNDTQDQKNFINTNNTFNNEYFRQENFNENQFYNNMNTTKQSKLILL